MDSHESDRMDQSESVETKIGRIDERTKFIKEKIELHCSQLTDHEKRLQSIESCQKVIESPSFYQKYQGIINLLAVSIIVGGFYYFLIFFLHVHGAAAI